MPRAEKDSNFRETKEAAEAQGWRVEKTKKNHWKFIPPTPGETPVFFSGSPGEWRSLANFIAQLRRKGFRPPSKMQGGKKRRRR